jgi:hypothetical protein
LCSAVAVRIKGFTATGPAFPRKPFAPAGVEAAMFGARLTLFRLLGFEVRLDASWLILAVLLTWSLARGYFPT